jgi:hypothetical protein
MGYASACYDPPWYGAARRRVTRADPAEAGSLANPPFPAQPFRSKAKPKFLPSFCASASLIHTIAMGSR